MDEEPKEESTQAQELPAEPVQEIDLPETPVSDPTPSYQDSIASLRAEFEKKFEDQRTKYEAEIAERDDVIKQIMTEPSAGASEPAGDPIVDKINATRHFIKW
jgi:hypothetical protein